MRKRNRAKVKVRILEGSKAMGREGYVYVKNLNTNAPCYMVYTKEKMNPYCIAVPKECVEFIDNFTEKEKK